MKSQDDKLNAGAPALRGSAPDEETQPTTSPDVGSLETVKRPGAGALVFNRYRLQRIIGRGGMGVVWLAVDTRLERAVAMKFLPDAVGSDEVALKELKDETRRGLDLAHPNIVRIYDFMHDTETAAISMEFVDGKSLSERRLTKPHKVFAVQDIAPWVGQMCDALDYAHLQKRIVHRDLKPANLMVNSESEIKITDFGIARSVSDTMSRLSRVAAQPASGTLLYMSPQQAMGDRPRPTDDVYALGATIYELLTGKPPFYSGDITAQITSKVAPLVKERREELEIGATDDIPKTWEDAIAACLKKDPLERPQTAGELARRLGLDRRTDTQGALLKAKAGGLRSIEVTTKSAAIPAKKKAPVIAVTLLSVMLLAAAAAVGSWWWKNRPGEMTVRTEPANARITLNDMSSLAPGTVPDLKPGAYTASIAQEGYEPQQIEFTVAAGQRVDLGLVNLQRSTGHLVISSNIDGPSYKVKSVTDENAPGFSGATPDMLKLPIGKYTVTAKHGEELKMTEVEVTRNSTARQQFVFAPPVPPPAPEPVVVAEPPTPKVTPSPPPAEPAPAPAPAPAPMSTPTFSVAAAAPAPTASTPTAPVPSVAESGAAPPTPKAAAESSPPPLPPLVTGVLSPPASMNAGSVPAPPAAPTTNNNTAATPPAAPAPIASGTPTTPPMVAASTAIAPPPPPAEPRIITAPPAMETAPVGPPPSIPTFTPFSATPPPRVTAPDLPESGYFSRAGLFATGPYEDYNAYAQQSILKRAQEKLKKNGFYSSSVDGTAGKGTQSALLDWQRDQGLPVTGRLDRATLASMGLTGLPETSPPKRVAKAPTPRPPAASATPAPSTASAPTATPAPAPAPTPAPAPGANSLEQQRALINSFVNPNPPAAPPPPQE